MGQAIAQRISKAGNPQKNKVYIYDKDAGKTKDIPCGIDVAAGIADLIENAKIIILAVKPQDFDGVINEISGRVQDKIIISIAAGITTGYIEKRLGEIAVIRAMPNLPAKIGQGMTGICQGRFDKQNYLLFAEALFNLTGRVITVKEDRMNAITAVSGSGPAYVCDFLEKDAPDIRHVSWFKKHRFLRQFRDAAEGVGFSKAQAGLLVKTTFSGTLAFLKKTKITPAQLKRQVASEGGTTEAALALRHSGGSWEGAVKAAEKRAEELCKI